MPGDAVPASRRARPRPEDRRSPTLGPGPQLRHGSWSAATPPGPRGRAGVPRGTALPRGSEGRGDSGTRLQEARWLREVRGWTEVQQRGRWASEGKGAEGPAGGLATQGLRFHFKRHEKLLTGFQQGGSHSDLCSKDTGCLCRGTWVTPRRGPVCHSETPGTLVAMETYPTCVSHRPAQDAPVGGNGVKGTGAFSAAFLTTTRESAISSKRKG